MPPDAIMTESRKIFSPNCVVIGFGKHVLEPGDVKPVEFNHGRDGRIRVFHSVLIVTVASKKQAKSLAYCTAPIALGVSQLKIS